MATYDPLELVQSHVKASLHLDSIRALIAKEKGEEVCVLSPFHSITDARTAPGEPSGHAEITRVCRQGYPLKQYIFYTPSKR